MDGDMVMPFLFWGIPISTMWITSCVLKRDFFILLIFFVFFSIFSILIGLMIYLGIRSGEGIYIVKDMNNFPYLNFFKVTIANSLMVSFLFIIVPSFCLRKKKNCDDKNIL
ncbi:hypothetical protein [Gilliamella sp. Bif1-4]|uniref:hypothetical protein n=1 Tax=Gilliamella sp. Bif1-4 TaxID=3120233 RepID=UPI00080E46BA|nr:hypothetical protein [Gilliamella apicola]OCG40845.1 hypothetical protein A9G25_06805 [Gilliamella apicola]